LYRRISNATVILEPAGQAVAAAGAAGIVVGKDASGSPVYLNEDSVTVVFDDSNLFRLNRFPGYDLTEDGLRLALAGRAMILWDDGRRANFVLGRSFRSGDSEVFSTTSGLASKASDWIVAVEAEPMAGVSLFARTRLDADSLAVRRAEAGANVQLKRGSGYFRYLKEEAASGSGRRENADLGGEVFLNENWGVTLYGNRDIAASAWVIRDIGVVYRDGCTRLDVIYRQEDIQVGQLGSSTSVNIRLTLATLGGPLGTR
jgi:LPS-assembly protein